MALDRGPAVDLRNDVLRMPLRVVGRGGNLMRVVRP
jgi:hypothetical protein